VSPLPGVHDIVKSVAHISVAVKLLIDGGATKQIFNYIHMYARHKMLKSKK